MRALWFLREAWATARSQPVGTLLVLVVATLTTLLPMVTAGRAEALQRSISADVETTYNRTLVLTVLNDGQFNSESVEYARAFSLVESAYSLGDPVDMQNAAFFEASGGRDPDAIAVYPFHGQITGIAHLDLGRWPREDEVVLTAAAEKAIGMIGPAGGLRANGVLRRVRDDPTGDLAVVGQITLSQGGVLGSTVGLSPAASSDAASRLVVVASTFSDVPRVERLLPGVLGLDPGTLRIESLARASDTLGAVTANVDRFGGVLVVVSVGVGSLFLSLIAFGIVQGRRRDFGRKRALGASRVQLVVMVLMQILVPSLLGCTMGAVSGWLAVFVVEGGRPSATFGVSVVVLGILATIAAALIPALLAAYRDPVLALRVP